MPVLVTPRLTLRPYRGEDAQHLAEGAGARAIADTTISIPHPYSIPAAREKIRIWQQEALERRGYHFAVCRCAETALIGGVELRDLDWEHLQAELGFWIAVPHQGQGLAREAVGALLGFGFETLGLWRIYAHHMVRNPASDRVLEGIGMRREGLLRDRVRKWGRFEDVVLRAIRRPEWQERIGRAEASDGAQARPR